MKKILTVLLGIGILILTQSSPSLAGPPLNNLEGVGGIAFNPLAYTAGTGFDHDAGKHDGLSYQDIISKPQVGIWYVSLSDVSVDWTAIGIAETFFKRLEVSYRYEAVAPNGKNIHKNNIGGKLLLLNENFNGLDFVPAVSVGTIYKKTSGAGRGCRFFGPGLLRGEGPINVVELRLRNQVGSSSQASDAPGNRGDKNDSAVVSKIDIDSHRLHAFTFSG